MPCKLSVITPVRDGSRFMEFCIRNVIDQGCPDAEHIIIDGGSTDGTVELIRRYAGEYPHIRWISERDRGQSDAMNRGIALAKGTIIGILNVDDYYEPGALNEVVHLFRTLPQPSLLVGNCAVWDDDDKLQFVGKPANIGLLRLLMLDIRAFPNNPSAYFYHRSLHDIIGGYDVNEHYGMDIQFLFQAAESARVTYVDRLWGNYRYLTGTKTQRDVASGQNRIRVTGIADFYRKRAPLHYRLLSRAVITLVATCKSCLRLLGG